MWKEGRELCSVPQLTGAAKPWRTRDDLGAALGINEGHCWCRAAGAALTEPRSEPPGKPDQSQRPSAGLWHLSPCSPQCAVLLTMLGLWGLVRSHVAFALPVGNETQGLELLLGLEEAQVNLSATPVKAAGRIVAQCAWCLQQGMELVQGPIPSLGRAECSVREAQRHRESQDSRLVGQCAQRITHGARALCLATPGVPSQGLQRRWERAVRTDHKSFKHKSH